MKESCINVVKKIMVLKGTILNDLSKEIANVRSSRIFKIVFFEEERSGS